MQNLPVLFIWKMKKVEEVAILCKTDEIGEKNTNLFQID